MRLPYTPASLALWLDPSEKYVTKDSNNKVLSVINRVNGTPIIQPTTSFQPTWGATSFNGTPGITFDGTQYLMANEIGPLFAGVRKPVTFVQAVLKPTAGFAVPVAISNGTVAGVSLYEIAFATAFTGHDFIVTYTDDTHTAGSLRVQYSDPKVFGTPFVFTATFDDNISLKINGKTIGTVANIKGQLTTDTCTIGACKIIGAIANQFTGTIGPTLIFIGSQGVVDAEQAVMQYCNISS